MQSGPEQFRDWMRRRGFNQADAARYLEYDQPYISSLLSGKRSPNLDNAVKIEERTGIPVRAWAATRDDGSVATGLADEPQPVDMAKR